MFFFFFSKPHISIVGEMTDIKPEADKIELQEKLNEVLLEINREYEDDISAGFMATVENEFQGLLGRGRNVMKIISELKNKMYPVNLRIGIGVGEITTDINPQMSISVKGPGYEKSREALEFLREEARRNQSRIADVHLEAEGDHKEKTKFVNTILSLMTSLEYDWSDRQREIVCDMIRHQDKQSNAAKRLGITQSTVQKSLTAAHYYTYEDALKTVEAVFNEIGEEK